MKNICLKVSGKMLLAATLLLASVIPALAQKITVTGTVIDPYGDPLIGATVIAQGTTVGVATDFDGNYTISVEPNAVLEFSYIGYTPKTVPVNGQTHIDVTLEENTVVLNEVVAIGYGTVKKSDATGSVAVVKPDDIEAGLSTSAQDLLVGASPGVVVTLDGGNPSSGGNILIRGGASLAASNDPLIVVDGVPMNMRTVVGASNPLALISPENVESMTILKDASATAIYGSRASNGVIIITTKKGMSGRPQVSFTANFYVNTPKNTLNMMTGDQFRDFIINTYGAESTQAGALGTANTDWQKEELRTTFSSDYSLSVGGTVKWLPYRIALSYTNNNGIIKHSAMDRATASINLTPSFFDDLLNIQANAKGSYIKNQYFASTMGTAISFNPTLPVRDFVNGIPDLNYWTTYDGAGMPFTPETWNGSVNSTAVPLNPIAGLLDNESRGTSWQSIGNLQIDLKMPFLRELRANLNLGYDIAKGSWFGYDYAFSPAAWNNGYGIIQDPNSDNITTVKNGGTSATKQSQLRRNLLLDFYLNYNKEFDKIASQFDITAGYSWQRFHNHGNEYSYVENTGSASWAEQLQGIPNIDSYLGTQAYPRTYYSDNLQLVSFFGRLNYIFKDKYLVTATVRWDGTSRFSKDHRWGTFPSVALGWKILEESFMESARGWMTELKLRAGYGVTGQQDLNDDFFPYLPVYSTGVTDVTHMYPFGDKYYWYVNPNAYNIDIKWEETHTWNAGVDFGFINNRITGSLEFYKRKTKDLLTFANYTAGSNLTNQGNINIGDLENLGIEFNLITRPVATRDVHWTSSFNIAWNKNKILRLAEGADTQTGNLGGQNGYVQKHEVGYPAYSFYVYEQVYDQDGNPLEGVFVDRNGDGEIDESDKYLFHSRDPKVTLTWNNTVNYKNWDFGIVLRSNIGNYMFNQNQMSNVFTSVTRSVPLSNIMADEFLFTGQKTTVKMQSDYFVQNASFLRCDNISIGYTWPGLLKDQLRLRLFGAVQNPFVITKYKGLDPEVFSGIDNDVYPKPVTFTVGLVANF